MSGTFIGNSAPVNEAGTVKVVSAPQVELGDMTELEILQSIEAKPLGFGDHLEIKPVRKEYKYRWINRFANGKQRYSQALALGWVNATEEDVELKDQGMVQDGVIVSGDVILMKMPIEKYYGAIKANMLKANMVMSKEGFEKMAKAEEEAALSKVRAPREYDVRSKVSVYRPPLGDINSKIT